MIDRSILEKYYWFNWISDETFEWLIIDSNNNIDDLLLNINNSINSKVTRILSLCTDSEIKQINNTNDFDHVVEIFEWIRWFSDNEYDILEQRFNLIKKESEK